jgi:type IV secretion system protein VirB9
MTLYSTASSGEAIPRAGALDYRIRYVDYNETQVFHVNAGIGQVTHLRFSKGEVFEKWYSGDSTALEFSSHKNYVQFKPIVKKINTNLLIHTNQRAYNIALHLDGSAYWGVHFRYPEAERKAAQQKQFIEETKELLNPANQFVKNNQYIGAGSDAIRPVRVFDNGTHTFFHFSEQTDIPSIFRVRRGDQEIITQAITYGNWRIVPRVQEKWTLRLGSAVLCIRNLKLIKDSPENTTDTISPKMIRTALTEYQKEFSNGQ